MAGRRPKPLAMHKLNGNPRHFSQAQLNGDLNPKPEVKIPEMPKGMHKIARREWRQIVPILLRMGVLNESNGTALAAYCRSVAEIEVAYKDMEKNGRNFTTHFEDKDGNVHIGDIKPNPAVAQFYTAMKTAKTFLLEFGLTPASLTKLKVEKAPAGDAMEQFLSRKKSAPLTIRPEDMTSGVELN